MKKLGKKALENRLSTCWENHFGFLSDICEWWANPNDDPLVWVFNIPKGNGVYTGTYKMTISDEGIVSCFCKPLCETYLFAMRDDFDFSWKEQM